MQSSFGLIFKMLAPLFKGLENGPIVKRFNSKYKCSHCTDCAVAKKKVMFFLYEEQ